MRCVLKYVLFFLIFVYHYTFAEVGDVSEYSQLLYFDLLKGGIKISDPILEYDLSDKAGEILHIGDMSISNKTLVYVIAPLAKVSKQASRVMSSSDKNEDHLIIKWPEGLFINPKLEVISKTGKVLWEFDISDKVLEVWNRKIKKWKSQLTELGVKPDEYKNNPLFNIQIAIGGLRSKGAPFFSKKEFFKFCLSSQNERSQSRLCSQMYGMKSTEGHLVMGKVRGGEATPRILYKNVQAKLKDSAQLDYQFPVSFYAEMKNGEIYEFLSTPQKPQIIDLSESNIANYFKIVGYGMPPLKAYKVINTEEYGKLTKLLGFESTITDTRLFWATALKKDNLVLYFPGSSGGIFRFNLDVTAIPQENDKIYIAKNTPYGTYNDDTKVYGKKPDGIKLTTNENEIEFEKDNPNLFLWRFKATERGQVNRSYLSLDSNGKRFYSFYEFYKGYPREFSLRLSGVASTVSSVFMGEVAYNQWFEDILGWSNSYLSRLRWGISFKYFNALNKLSVTADSAPVAFSAMDVDLKYRFPQGLWGRDEAIGPIISYHSVTYDQIVAPILGFGAFWARSMPKVFDNFLNLLPFMRYPKWVDMEFIMYVTSLKDTIQINPNYALNFHGKILWTNNIFGEAGFGLKKYSFYDAETDLAADFASFYATMGLGVNF